MATHVRKTNAFAAAAALFAASLVLEGCRSDGVQRLEPDIQPPDSVLRRMTLQDTDAGLCHQAVPTQSLGPNEMGVYILCPGGQGNDQEPLKQATALAAKETLSRGYTHFRLTDWRIHQPGWRLLPTEIPPPPPGKVGYSLNFVMYHDGEQGNSPLYDYLTSRPVYDARKILPAGAKKL